MALLAVGLFVDPSSLSIANKVTPYSWTAVSKLRITIQKYM